MKKALMVVLCLSLAFTAFACGSKDDNSKSKDNTYEIAMITDVGTIDDKSFNQGTWEGVKEWAEKNDVTYKYYQPAEDTNKARMEQIDLAVKAGAKVIATPGFLFQEPIFQAQSKYPDVKFIFIDGAPAETPESAPEIKDNTVSIVYAEEQAGYLAGYAAVKEGNTKLGFMGGMAVPAVVRYGYGFVKGANDAAAEDNKNVSIKYNYTGDFKASPDIKAKAAGWYADGTEVIFSCGGAIFDSISSAAEESNGKVIGVDVDQSSQSKTVITSAMKLLKESVKDQLDAYKKDEFKGGEALILGAKEGRIGLPMKTSQFKKFKKDDYKKIYDKLADGGIEIPNDKDTQEADLASKVPNVNLMIIK